jgi:hypothetical protein
MGEVDDFAVPDEAPAPDAIEQRLAVDPADETRLDADELESLGDRDANAADVIDQAIIVPVPDDE